MLTASRNKNFLQSKFQIFHDFPTLKMFSSFFGKINLECTVCVFLIDCVFDRVCGYLHDSVPVHLLHTDEVEMDNVTPNCFCIQYFHFNFFQ